MPLRAAFLSPAKLRPVFTNFSDQPTFRNVVAVLIVQNDLFHVIDTLVLFQLVFALRT